MTGRWAGLWPRSGGTSPLKAVLPPPVAFYPWSYSMTKSALQAWASSLDTGKTNADTPQSDCFTLTGGFLSLLPKHVRCLFGIDPVIQGQHLTLWPASAPVWDLHLKYCLAILSDDNRRRWHVNGWVRGHWCPFSNYWRHPALLWGGIKVSLDFIITVVNKLFGKVPWTRRILYIVCCLWSMK